ncbi:hypothetical protein A6R70_02995 [Agrobacterium rubi]|nr:hypothetical protein [Agrobacterium rubi]
MRAANAIHSENRVRWFLSRAAKFRSLRNIVDVLRGVEMSVMQRRGTVLRDMLKRAFEMDAKWTEIGQFGAFIEAISRQTLTGC